MELSDLLFNALNALEREQKMPETIVERGENIPRELSDLTSCFEEKMNEASVNEKERLRSLLRLLESKLADHDLEEQQRFATLSHQVYATQGGKVGSGSVVEIDGHQSSGRRGEDRQGGGLIRQWCEVFQRAKGNPPPFPGRGSLQPIRCR